METNFALISLIALVVVFVIGAFKKNPLHIGILAMAVAYIIGKWAGLKDTAIYAFFPTTMFVRVFGIMFFFAIAQANGAIELLAKKLVSKMGSNAKLMPFFLFYVGVFLGSIGINSLAGMAILSGIGISLAVASNNNALLYGIAGGYGIACGCYSPINEYTANIISAAEGAGLSYRLVSIYLLNLVAFSLSFLVIYLLLGGLRGAGKLDVSALGEVPKFSRGQLITLIGIPVIVAVVAILKLDIGWAGLLVAVMCILCGAEKCGKVLKTVSLPSLILICGVGTLVNLVNHQGGFDLMSGALTKIMNTTTSAPIMTLTASALSLFTISRLVVVTLVPTIPGILETLPAASPALLLAATCAGAFASSIGPLSANGALIMSNLSQQFGEERASKLFSKQMLMGVVGAFVVAAFYLVLSLFA